MPFAFEKLAVYQKAVSFADACCSLTKDYPRGYFFLSDQLNRAALELSRNNLCNAVVGSTPDHFVGRQNRTLGKEHCTTCFLTNPLSIAASLAEGNGRFTKPDRRNFFGIARGSVQECVPLLELAARQGLLTAAA